MAHSITSYLCSVRLCYCCAVVFFLFCSFVSVSFFSFAAFNFEMWCIKIVISGAKEYTRVVSESSFYLFSSSSMALPPPSSLWPRVLPLLRSSVMFGCCCCCFFFFFVRFWFSLFQYFCVAAAAAFAQFCSVFFLSSYFAGRLFSLNKIFCFVSSIFRPNCAIQTEQNALLLFVFHLSSSWLSRRL